MKFGTNISLAENLPEYTGHESKNRLEGGFLGRIEFSSGEVGPNVSAKSEGVYEAEVETLKSVSQWRGREKAQDNTCL